MVSRRSEKWIVLAGFSLFLVVYVLLLLQWRHEDVWRDSVREMRDARNRLMNVALALELYHEDHGAYPPAVVQAEDGAPQHSWRVLLLPYLEGDAFLSQYRLDEPWDGPHNRALKSADVEYFPFASSTENTTVMTEFVAVVGNGTMWPPDGSLVSHDDFGDGRAATLSIVEIGNSDIPWLEPRDLSLRELMRGDAQKANNIFGAGRMLPGRWFWQQPTPVVLAASADGAGRVIPRMLDARTWQSLLTIDGGEPEPIPTLDPERLPIR